MVWKPSRGIVMSLLMALVVLALAMYGVAVSPAEAPSRPPQASLSASRFFVLLPDGRVEMTDAYTRRVFRWDGKRWLELESHPVRPIQK
jgi:hypothetical protein